MRIIANKKVEEDGARRQLIIYASELWKALFTSVKKYNQHLTVSEKDIVITSTTDPWWEFLGSMTSPTVNGGEKLFTMIEFESNK